MIRLAAQIKFLSKKLKKYSRVWMFVWRLFESHKAKIVRIEEEKKMLVRQLEEIAGHCTHIRSYVWTTLVDTCNCDAE